MSHTSKRPLIIAGPCLAESLEVMELVAEKMSELSEELAFDYVFKASFDKANRSSIASPRGPGLKQALEWFEKIKLRYHCKILTDVHETFQVEPLSEVCDVLQIPAFLCRQTDLLIAAVKSGKPVNIKKGQFLAPEAMGHILGKVKETARQYDLNPQAWLTERGFCFGYGDLLVDMRSFPILATYGFPVIFDITHSTQKPPSSNLQSTSLANRAVAPVLARAAAASGYVDGFFLEVHPDPAKAQSDQAAQLNLEQASHLLKNLVEIWHQARVWKEQDKLFLSENCLEPV